MNYFLSLIVAGSFLMACTNNESENSALPPNERGEANISVSIVGASDTRQDTGVDNGTEAERKINRIEIYVFNESDNKLDGTTPVYLKEYGAEGYDGQGLNFLVQGGGKKLLTVINADLLDMMEVSEATLKSYTYGEMRALITNSILGSYDDYEKEVKYLRHNGNSRTAPSLYIMSGEANVEAVEGVPNNYVLIPVSRLLSKVNAPVMSSAVVELTDAKKRELLGLQPEDEINGTFSFNYRGYGMINGMSRSDMYPNWNAGNIEKSLWSSWDATNKGRWTSRYGSDNLPLSFYSQKEGDSFWIPNTLTSDVVYVYENSPALITDANGLEGYVKESVYAFLIQGNLIFTAGDGSTRTFERYWRVNLIRDDEYKIFRNAIYTVTVQKIRSIGYKTPAEAEEDKDIGEIIPKDGQTGILAEIKVMPWRLKVQNTDM